MQTPAGTPGASSNLLSERERSRSRSRSSSPALNTRQGDDFTLLLSTLQAASPEQRSLLSEMLRSDAPVNPSVHMSTLASMQKAMSTLSTSHAKDTVSNYSGEQKDVYKFLRQLRLHHERWLAPKGTTRLWLLSKFKGATTSWAEKVLSKSIFPNCEEFCREVEERFGDLFQSSTHFLKTWSLFLTMWTAH